MSDFKEMLSAKLDALSDEEWQKRDAKIAEKEKQETFLQEADNRKRILRSWQKRGVTERYINSTWDNWIADTDVKKEAKEKVKTAWRNNLFLTGSNGTGKTHLAMCLAKDGATYRRFPDILREIRTDFDNEAETLDCYGKIELLIIDEIGRQKFSDFETNILFEIIDRRWNNVLPTTIITNLSTQEFAERFGTAILDRLKPVLVLFSWESMR